MSSEIEALYKQAESAEKARDFEKALECYQKILQKASDEDHAYYGAANAYAVRGLVPQVVAQYLKLAEVLEGKNQLDGALEVCQWVISIDPANTQARARLIDVLDKQGKKKEAIQQSLALSRIYSTLGHGEQSIALLQKLKELDPDNPDLTLQLGEIYIKQGQIGEGIALYKTIAQDLLKRGEHQKALDVLKRIKAIKNNDVENLASLGQVYVELGRLEEAKAEFRQMLRQDLNHIGALSQLGLIAKMQGQWDEARVPFRKIVELDPNSAFGHENFAEVNEVLGNQVEAVRQYLAAAELYEKMNEHDKAVEIYQNVLALDPEHSTAHRRLQSLGAPEEPRKRVQEAAARLRQENIAAEEPVAEPSERPEPRIPAEAAPEPASGRPQKRLIPKGISKQEAGAKSPPGQKSPLLKPPGPEGIPRTGPAAKPILTNLRGGPRTPPERIKEPRAEEEARAVEEPVAEEKPPASIIEELPFPEEPSQVQAVYVDQAAQRATQSEIEEAPTREAESSETEPVHAEEPAYAEEPTEEPSGARVEERLLVPVAVAPPAPHEPLHLPALEEMVAQNRIGPAIQWCKEALRESPGDPGLLRALGDLYFKHGYLEEAAALFKDLAQTGNGDSTLLARLAEACLFLDRREEYADALVLLSKAEFAEGRFAGAMESLLHALAWNRDHVEARRTLVAVLKEQKLDALASYHHCALMETLEASNAVNDLIPVYQSLLEAKPDAPVIRYRLALSYQELGRIEEAKQEFLFLSTHYGAQGEQEKEAENLERVHALDPTDKGVMARLRDVYLRVGKKDVALRLELRLGDSSVQGGDLDSALASYRKILAENPHHEEALSRMVDLLSRKGSVQEAVLAGQHLAEICAARSDFQKAAGIYGNLLQLNPENQALHQGLASLYAKMGQTSKAIQEYMVLGALCSKKALFNEAIAAYREVLSLDGTYKDARYQLGVIYADHKSNWEDALAEFKKVKNLDPHHTAALSRLAKGYAAQGDVETALGYIRELLRLDSENVALIEQLKQDTEEKLKTSPDNYQLLFNVGVLHKELGRFDEAIQKFQKVIKHQPLALRAYCYQGQCWEEKAVHDNQAALFQTALKVYRKGLDLKGYKDEEYLELKYTVSRLLESMGKISEAVPLYQEIIAVDMDYRDSRDRKKQLEEELSSGKVTRLPPSRRQESAP